jgi:hypothetical protein
VIRVASAPSVVSAIGKIHGPLAPAMRHIGGAKSCDGGGFAMRIPIFQPGRGTFLLSRDGKNPD